MPALLVTSCKGRPEATNFSAKASIEAVFIRSISSIFTLGIPSRLFRAFSRFMAGTMLVLFHNYFNFYGTKVEEPQKVTLFRVSHFFNPGDYINFEI